MKTKADRCGGCGGKVRYTDASYHYLGKLMCMDCFMTPVSIKPVDLDLEFPTITRGKPELEESYDFENDPPEAYSWKEDEDS